MHQEQLFEMVNKAVDLAKTSLEDQQELQPFAMVLYRNGFTEEVTTTQEGADNQYDALITQLRLMVTDAPKITGIAIVALVNIPAQYKAPVESGIRVHLEERHKQDDKVGGRFLYVPYQLYKEKDTQKVSIHLYDPIPVSIPHEVFLNQ